MSGFPKRIGEQSGQYRELQKAIRIEYGPNVIILKFSHEIDPRVIPALRFDSQVKFINSQTEADPLESPIFHSYRRGEDAPFELLIFKVKKVNVGF